MRKFAWKKIKIVFCFLMLSFCWSACKSTDVKPEQQADGETYFSVKQFFDDQWQIRRGVPYTLMRIATFNGISDSAFLGMDSTLWQNIRARFDEADISDPKFLGQYKFSLFRDDHSGIVFLNYEAQNPDLFMRKMNIGMDQVTHRVETLYIETAQKSRIYSRKQKLLYIPGQSIQIQESEKSIIAPIKNLNIKYIYKS